jgi:hypothetical protein
MTDSGGSGRCGTIKPSDWRSTPFTVNDRFAHLPTGGNPASSNTHSGRAPNT